MIGSDVDLWDTAVTEENHRESNFKVVEGRKGRTESINKVFKHISESSSHFIS